MKKRRASHPVVVQDFDKVLREELCGAVRVETNRFEFQQNVSRSVRVCSGARRIGWLLATFAECCRDDGRRFTSEQIFELTSTLTQEVDVLSEFR